MRNPPRLPLRFFRWFCHQDLVDSIEGDLMELYQERLARGRRYANFKFAADVILLFRPAIIKPLDGYQHENNYGMLKSYVKIGWRNLLKNKGYSLINIGGLALGMTVAMLIGLWLYDELTFNTYHENYDHIGRVYHQNSYAGEIETNAVQVTGLGTLLRNDYTSQFDKVVIMRGRPEERVLSLGENRFTESGYFMQSEGPEMLGLKMVFGTNTNLDGKNTIMLSQSLAKRIFKDENPVGQVLSMDSRWELKVVGVYEDLPNNSEFREAAYIAPLDVYLDGWADLDAWDNYHVYVYVQLNANQTFTEASLAIKDAMIPHVDERTAATKPSLFVLPMSDWHLASEFENGAPITSSRMRAVWYFSIIGLFVLLLASINFMNLSTARSEKRAKEVGIRKSIGSVRSQLIYQFYSEAFLVAILSLIVSMIVVKLMLPGFNFIAGKQIVIPWSQWQLWAGTVGFTFFTGILAGSYPALYLSSFNPVQVLKGTFKGSLAASLPRRVLVVVQFSISIALIAGTAIVYSQIQYGKDRSVGYSREGLISLRLGSYGNRGDVEVLRNELKKTQVVDEIAEANYEVTSTMGWNDAFSWRDKEDDISDLAFNTIFVTHGYSKTIGLEFVEGRDFSPEIESDSKGVLINESAAKLMREDNPIGETLIWYWGERRLEYKVLGIVKDMVKGSPFEPTDPSMIFLSGRPEEWLYIRMNPRVSTREAISKIEDVFSALNPSVPFDFAFADEKYNAKFKAEERVGALAAVFSFLAIVISCLGLVGLASFVAEQRTKEIGIRKVLGATVTQIWSLLSKEFVMLVGISCAIAIPLTYTFMSSWLEQYAYRTTIPWHVFTISGIGALSLALLMVSFQSLRAGVSNPVNSLRSE